MSSSSDEKTLAERFQSSIVFVAFEVIAFVSVLLAVWAFFVDLEDRESERIARAWQLVTTQAPGNSGKVAALEYLVSQGVSLTGIDLATGSDKQGVYLAYVNLSNANLSNANLQGAVLTEADFSGANLTNANLSGSDIFGGRFVGANLTNANLSGAELFSSNFQNAKLFNADLVNASLVETKMQNAELYGANLNGARLMSADLQQAKFTYLDQGVSKTDAKSTKPIVFSEASVVGAFFSGADLSGAIISNKQLESVCGDRFTKIDSEYTFKSCPSFRHSPHSNDANKASIAK